MTLETILLPLISAILGWAARHYGIVAPSSTAPQTHPAGGGAVSPPPVMARLEPLIQSVVSAEVQKGIAYLECRLFPPSPSVPLPQTGPAT